MELQSFIGASYESAAFSADVEQTFNWYVENLESPGATKKRALLPTPGVTSIATATTGAGRGHFFMDGREFAVIGTTFYEIDNAGTLTSRGTVALDTNPATISSNGDGGGQLFVTSGGNGYYYNLSTNVLTQIAALNGKATMGDHLDGYFLAIDVNTSTLYISALLDGSTWDTGVDFAQRSAAPDPWVAMIVAQSSVWLLGQLTSEVWYNSGASFPFAKHPAGLVKYGCAAPFSADIVDQGLTWLSTADKGGYQIVRATGYSPERISSYALEHQISGYTTVSNAQSDVYSEDGHTFFIITFPSHNATHAWDIDTKLWCNRGTWLSGDNMFTSWRPRWHAFAFGEHRILDSEDGNVYRMANTITTDVDGAVIRRVRRSPAIVQDNKLMLYPGFELDMDRGQGATTGQGADPQVMMRFSKDGGKTWSSERMRSAGKIGEYGKRIRWNRLGSARRMAFEVSVTDPFPSRLTGAYLTPNPKVLDTERAA